MQVMEISKLSNDRVRRLWNKVRWLSRDKRQVFRFMDLPLELRRLIYAHVVNGSRVDRLPMPLMAISKQLRSEVSDVLFEIACSVNDP
jgi:hypothetical protein